MILAGLSAEGETLVRDAGHVCRGYEELDGCLRRLGARIVYEGEENGSVVQGAQAQ